MRIWFVNSKSNITPQPRPPRTLTVKSQRKACVFLRTPSFSTHTWLLAFCPVTVKEGAQAPKGFQRLLSPHCQTVCWAASLGKDWTPAPGDAPSKPNAHVLQAPPSVRATRSRDSETWKSTKNGMPFRPWPNCLFWKYWLLSISPTPSPMALPPSQVTSFNPYIECTLRKLVT